METKGRVQPDFKKEKNPTHKETLFPINLIISTDDDLNGGEIVGIVVGSLAGLTLLGASDYWINKKYQIETSKKYYIELQSFII